MPEFTPEELAEFAAIPNPDAEGLVRGNEVKEEEEPTDGDR